jgi:protein gp37
VAENSKIEWCDHTFNPWRGCVHVKGSRACAFCYAEQMSKRNPLVLGRWGTEEGGGTRVVGADDYWKQPLRWNLAAGVNGERMRVFCASLADVFEDWRGPMLDTKGERLFSYVDINATAIDGSIGMTLDDVRGHLWLLIERTPNLDWLLLTKRPENILRMVPEAWREGFPPNVWVGVTVEDQRWADERIPHLLNVPARVRFLSCEPLCGPVDVSRHLTRDEAAYAALSCYYGSSGFDATGSQPERCGPRGVDWVIAGGESGPHAQPSHPDWFRSLRSQCNEARVPFLFKQHGEWIETQAYATDDPKFCAITPEGRVVELTAGWGLDHPGAVAMQRVGKKAAGRLLDGREWNQLPAGLLTVAEGSGTP